MIVLGWPRVRAKALECGPKIPALARPTATLEREYENRVWFTTNRVTHSDES